jgi:hypothetical protein
MQKYRSALEVCAHTEVQKYQTKQLAKLVATKHGHRHGFVAGRKPVWIFDGVQTKNV